MAILKFCFNLIDCCGIILQYYLLVLVVAERAATDVNVPCHVKKTPFYRSDSAQDLSRTRIDAVFQSARKLMTVAPPGYGSLLSLFTSGNIRSLYAL